MRDTCTIVLILLSNVLMTMIRYGHRHSRVAFRKVPSDRRHGGAMLNPGAVRPVFHR